MPKVQKGKPTIISSTHLQRNFGNVMRRATINKEHFIIERDGFPMIAILPATEYEVLMKGRRREK